MQEADEVLAPVEAAASACLAPYLGVWERSDEMPCRTVLQALAAAVERHAELVTTAGLAGDPPTDADERTVRLLEYRRGIDTGMLVPLSTAYRNEGPTTSIVSALERASDTCVRLCSELPKEASATWPEDALRSTPSDSLGRRIGKVFARLLSAARKSGTERTLPLRNVASEHLEASIAPEADRVGAHALVHWGVWSHRLEAAWIDWGRAALPALVRAELPSEDADDTSELWSTVAEAAQALQLELTALVESHPNDEALKESQAKLGAAREALQADLAVAGSFLYRPGPSVPTAKLRRVARLAPALAEWDAGVDARLALYLSLLSILSGTTAVQQRMVFRVRDRCLSGLASLLEIANRLEELAAEVDGADEALEGRLEELNATVASALEPTKDALPHAAGVDVAVKDISDNTIEALTAMVRQAPATLVLHSATAKVPTGGGGPETRSLPLQELARQSFDALRMERIRSATEGLVTALEEARANLAELRGVYKFARDEALRELESGEDGAGDRANDLIVGALDSIAEALRAQVTNLRRALDTARTRLATEIAEGSGALLERVGAGRMESRLFAARSRVAELKAWVNEKWGPPVERAARYMKVRFARLRRLGARVLRKGSAIVGSAPTETAASTRTLQALADVRGQIEGLPLVYQRLFTLEPISDPALLAGRDAQLMAALARWRRWHDADGVPVVVRGPQGSGVTSFLNVLAARIEEEGGSVVRSALDRRIAREAELASYLADLLELKGIDSMDGLASAIFDVESSDLPAAVALDNLEHLYLRVPQGTDLMERLLTLMAETEPRIFWIGGVSASAWQLIATAEPAAVSQVDVFDLPPLTAETMRSAMMLRHRRSGLAIHFDEPTAGRHLLRRRLRRMRDAEGYEELLEQDFFDRLYKASGGHLGLALYQWLTCADFTQGDGVHMKQPERPDFSILETLNLTQNFTLKAFLEHRSLTLDEHDRVFRVPRHESYQIFESLRNRHIIGLLPGADDDPDARSEIEEQLHYRVRPLLRGAIISHLQGLNIVH